MQRAPAVGGRSDALPDQLAVAPGTDNGVVGRRVEGDDDSRDSGRTPRPGRLPMIRLPAQCSWKNQTPTR